MTNAAGTRNVYGRAIGAGLIGLAALAAEGLLTAPSEAGVNPSGWDLATAKKCIAAELYSGATGVFVAAGDVDGDGKAEMVAGNGPGVDNTFVYQKYNGTDFQISKSVKIDTPDTHQLGIRMAIGKLNDDDPAPNPIYADASGSQSRVSFPFGKVIVKYETQAYAYPQTKGVYVAAGDVDGDGFAELVTGPSVGGNTGGLPPESVVKVFSVDNAGGISLSSSFTPYAGFTGGVRVAKGDVNGDGFDEIITAPDLGISPELRVFTYDKQGPWKLASSLIATSSGSPGGVWVAAGDVNGDGRADIVTGADAGGLPIVKVYSYNLAASGWDEINSFLAFDPSFTGGVTVAAGEFTGDAFADVFTAPATAVPEPGCIALAACGGLAMLKRRRRRPNTA